MTEQSETSGQRTTGQRTAAFSLLLPVYAGDNPEFLRLAFESSVDQQTLRPAEVVIVQDGPVPEAMREELARLEQASPVPVRMVRLPENGGLANALNEGIAHCAYEVVARMDADDVSLPERFERQWALIEDGVEVLGTGLVEFEHDPDVTGAMRTPPVGATAIREHARKHSPFNHPTMMYRKQAVVEAGGYPPLHKMEDYPLWVALIAGGARVDNIADPLVKYRVGAGAFARRGGWQLAKAEWTIQRQMRDIDFITRGEYLRNVVLKGGYRLAPAWVKRVLYRRFV